MNEQEETASADTSLDTTPKRPWTPGPWIADDNEGYGQWTIWEGRSPTGYLPPGRMIAKGVGECAQSEADTRLIACAPELFEALDRLKREAMFCNCGAGDGAIKQAEAALAKALGGQP